MGIVNYTPECSATPNNLAATRTQFPKILELFFYISKNPLNYALILEILSLTITCKKIPDKSFDELTAAVSFSVRNIAIYFSLV
jgi:hypothetical protein